MSISAAALAPSAQAVADAKELKKVFGESMNELFYGHMLKSMRSTVGEPAYFSGGQAEQTMQARLDMQLGQEMAKSTSGSLTSEAMFEQQFPKQAAILKQAAEAEKNLKI